MTPLEILDDPQLKIKKVMEKAELKPDWSSLLREIYSRRLSLISCTHLRFYELNGSVLCWKWWLNGECNAALW